MADDNTPAAKIRLVADNSAFDPAIAGAKKSLADLGVAAGSAGQRGAAGLAAIRKESELGGLSAKAYASALRQVPAQFTDIVTGLSAGQSPLTVLLQQGGQLKDVFGGIAPAARALSSYIVGLINPFTVAAAAAAVLVAAIAAGEKEMSAYANALILSGNAAGTTTSQLQAMATQIARATGATQGAAAEAVAAMAQTGDIAAENLQKTAAAALVFERATDTAIGDIIKRFTDLGRAPLDASIKLNESFHYLTLSVYEQIRALELAGRHTEAATVAQRAYADAIETRGTQVIERLGTIERLWLRIKDAAKGAADAILGIGRVQTFQQQLETVNAQIAKAKGPFDPSIDGNAELRAQLPLLEARKENLLEMIRLDNRAADAAKAYAEQVAARIRFDQQGDEAVLSNQAKMEREITKARTDGAAAGIAQIEIEKRVADIRSKYADKGAARSVISIDKDMTAADLEAVRQASEQLLNTYRNQERVLEMQRAGGLLNEADYYRRKRELVLSEQGVEEQSLNKQIERLRRAQDTIGGKDAIDNQRKIAEAESKLVILRANSAAKLDVLAEQQQAAVRKLEASFLQARQAAQGYFDALQRQQGRTLTFGQGNATREFNAGAAQIEDHYSDARRDAENKRAIMEAEGKFTDDQRAQYEARLHLIDEFESKSLASYSAYYQQRRNQEADADLGVQEAVANYLDAIGAKGKATEQAVSSVLQTLEDDLAGVFTGKGLDAKRVVDQIISEFLRLRIIRPILQDALGSGGGLLGFFNAVFGSSGGGGGYAFDQGESLAVGTNYVPYDGFRATLHKGEAVVPKIYNPAAGGKAAGAVNYSPTFNLTVGDIASKSDVAQAVAAQGARDRVELQRMWSRGQGVFR